MFGHFGILLAQGSSDNAVNCRGLVQDYRPFFPNIEHDTNCEEYLRNSSVSSLVNSDTIRRFLKSLPPALLRAVSNELRNGANAEYLSF